MLARNAQVNAASSPVASLSEVSQFTPAVRRLLTSTASIGASSQHLMLFPRDLLVNGFIKFLTHQNKVGKLNEVMALLGEDMSL
ncbi:hypothetical protein NPIL_312761 [Nephila pilipes]|uniref:Uncharacterized protein n=1 Tax=Nephila pilipes TaxID=299642 RepID=A0A8X6MYH2_NEPPI|nr:hypothetical protein NPIL_312761 [Nephila pilipes]